MLKACLRHDGQSSGECKPGPLSRRALCASSWREQPHRIVTAIKSQIAQRLENPHRRQALSRRLVFVRGQKPLQLLQPRTKLWHRLHAALRTRNAVVSDRIAFRTAFREIFSSRQIALIGFF